MKDLPDHIASEFPVEIDCAQPMPEGMPAMATGGTKGKKSKPQPVYPSLYLRDCENIDQIPAEGYALVYFKRRSLTTTEHAEQGDSQSAELEIQEVCLPPTSSDEETEDLEGAMESMAKERGIIPNDEAEQEEEEEEETE
jgi:hypothetical protein